VNNPNFLNLLYNRDILKLPCPMPDFKLIFSFHSDFAL
jgi:hypothetical protein